MEMETVLTSFRDLCGNPVAWVIAGVAAAKALYSLVAFYRCPVVNRGVGIAPEVARAAIESRFLRSPRFLFAMLAGLTLAVGGLYALRSPDAGPAALAAIVVGVFILLVEPSRLTISDNTLRVAAARPAGGEAYEFALERLRGAHLERISIEIAFAMLLVVVIAVY
jgi:hypothetical protein